MSSKTSVIAVVLVTDLIGYLLILASLPAVLHYYKLNDKDELYHWIEKKINVFQLYFGIPPNFNVVLFSGLLGLLFSCLQFLFSPLIGALSDVYGRKPVLIITMIGNALSYGIYAVSEKLNMFIIARIVEGISKANTCLYYTIISDLYSLKQRGKGMAFVPIAHSIVFTLGPMLGVFLFDYAGKFVVFICAPLVALGLTIFDVLFLLLYFKESLPYEKRAASFVTGLSDALSYINPFSMILFKPVKNIKDGDLTILRCVGGLYFLYELIYSGLEFTLNFLVHELLKFSTKDQLDMVFFIGITVTFIRALYVSRVKVGKEISAAAYGIGALIPAFTIIGISRNRLSLYFGLIPFTFSFATITPVLTTFISTIGPEYTEKGKLLGTFRAVGYLARGMGPVFCTLGYFFLGPKTTYCLGGMFFTAPLYCIYKLSKAVRKYKKKKK